jgi:uncharacterized tellurite resistance protein B-like protein
LNEDAADSRFEGTTLIVETGSGPARYDSRFLVAALLVFVAKGDGNISEIETEKMLQLVEEHFHLQSAESLALLTRAMSDLADDPDLTTVLRDLSTVLSPEEKEEIALMLLKLVAADGHRDVDEMEMLNVAAEIMAIAPESRHRAFERYFAEQQG